MINATMFVWFEIWFAGMRPGKSTGSGPSTSGSDKEDGLPCRMLIRLIELVSMYAT